MPLLLERSMVSVVKLTSCSKGEDEGVYMWQVRQDRSD